MVAKEYSKALYELAEELNNVDVIKIQFNNVIQLLKDDELINFFNSSAVKTNEKKDILLKSFEGFSEKLIHFLYVLLDNNRFNLINEIYEEFINFYYEKNNMISIKLFSAEKLKEREIKTIINSLEKRFDNKKIIYENIVDNSLIGGIRVLANGIEINMNVKTSILDLKNSL